MTAFAFALGFLIFSGEATGISDRMLKLTSAQESSLPHPHPGGLPITPPPWQDSEIGEMMEKVQAKEDAESLEFSSASSGIRKALFTHCANPTVESQRHNREIYSRLASSVSRYGSILYDYERLTLSAAGRVSENDVHRIATEKSQALTKFVEAHALLERYAKARCTVE